MTPRSLPPGLRRGRRVTTLRRTAPLTIAVCVAVAAWLVGVQQPAAQAEPGAHCVSNDPTAGGNCVDPNAIDRVQHTYTVAYTANGQQQSKTFTAENDILRPLSYVDARVGPDQHMERVRIIPPCSYYRIYNGKRMFDYPAMNQFMAGTPETLANPPVPRSHWIFDGDIQRMQLPNGLGLVEQPWLPGTSDPLGGTGGVHTRYTGPIHLHLPQIAEHRTDPGAAGGTCSAPTTSTTQRFPRPPGPSGDQSVLGMLHSQAPFGHLDVGDKPTGQRPERSGHQFLPDFHHLGWRDDHRDTAAALRYRPAAGRDVEHALHCRRHAVLTEHASRRHIRLLGDLRERYPAGPDSACHLPPELEDHGQRPAGRGPRRGVLTSMKATFTVNDSQAVGGN